MQASSRQGFLDMSSLLKYKKIALVHDWLNGMRGGEKCLEVFCELYPHADLFALVYEKGTLSQTIESVPITTSFIQKLPFGLSHYRNSLPLFPLAVEPFNLNDYDVVFSSSHCVAKGVRHGRQCYHISYIHSPMRYIWDSFDLYFKQRRTPLQVRLSAEIIRPFMKYWDRKSSQRVDTFLCNSRYIHEKIRNLYNREARVIYPPVDLSGFQPGGDKADYYLMVGALAPNKRVDLAIEAFNRLKYPLKIVGKGQDAAFCRSIAASNVVFLGNVDDHRLTELYQQARAFVFPGIDDCGITPLEAQACGTPVIAYAAGGALETVTRETGLFFRHPTTAALMETVEQMEKQWQQFSTRKLVRHVQRFNRERFKSEIAQAVEEGYSQWLNRSGREAQGKIPSARVP